MQTKQTKKPLFRGRGTYALATVSVALALATGVVGGCGGGGSDNATAPAQTRQVVERVEGPLRITASIPKRTYRKGEAVAITFSVTNLSDKDVQTSVAYHGGLDYIFLGGYFGHFDVQQGNTALFDSLLSWSGSGHETLPAGTTRTETFKWNQSDVRTYLPLQTPYRREIFAANTALPGEYQIVPRLSVHVIRYSALISSQSDVVSANLDGRFILPPLSVTIKE